MAKQVQRRRGTTAEHSSFTGAAGEITVDTDKNTVIVHDGSTAGGIELKQGLNAAGLMGDAIIYSSAGATDWTKPTDLKFILVHVVGAGAGGGGADADSGNAEGGGGGGGGYAFKKIDAGSLAGTETVTVGAAGGGGGASGTNGSAGGTSSFGAHASATGGSGGTGDIDGTTGQNNHAGGIGGAGSGGDINSGGRRGAYGRVIDSDRSLDATGGDAAGPWGGSGGARASAGHDFGGGGAGGDTGSASGVVGHDGADGGVIVYEYF